MKINSQSFKTCSSYELPLSVHPRRCPFCNHYEININTHDKTMKDDFIIGPFVQLSCDLCGATGPKASAGNDQDRINNAIKGWNGVNGAKIIKETNCCLGIYSIILLVSFIVVTSVFKHVDKNQTFKQHKVWERINKID